MLSTETIMPETEAKSVAKALDIADLVGMLLACDKPDTNIDLLVDLMLGEPEVRQFVDGNDIRKRFWMRGQVPAYTAEDGAVYALARTRGLRIDRTNSPQDGWISEARNLVTGRKVRVRHASSQIGALICIAAITAGEMT